MDVERYSTIEPNISTKHYLSTNPDVQKVLEEKNQPEVVNHIQENTKSK